MSYSLSPWLKPRFFITGTNRPLAGGLMYTYKAGTTTNATTYSDDAGTPNTNPIQLDSDGQCDLFLDDAVSYRIILKNSAGVVQFDKDRIASLGSTQVQSFNSIAALRLRSGTTIANAAKTLGYYSAGDGGGNSFYWDSTSVATDNGGTVIKPTAVSGSGRWLAVDISSVSVLQFGADSTGGKEATAIFTAALAASNNIIVPSGTYKIKSVSVAANKNIITIGAVTIQQLSGVGTDERTFVITGSNVSIGNMTIIGNIATDTGEQRHGILCQANTTTGNISNVKIGNITGVNIRGDVIYVGQGAGASTAILKNVNIGHVIVSNVYRNGVSIVSGDNIKVESVTGTTVGFCHLDIESNAGSGTCTNINVGYVKGRNFGIIGTTATDYCESIYVDHLDLSPSHAAQSTPSYAPGVSILDGLLLRNVKTVKINSFKAVGFNRCAIFTTYGVGELGCELIEIGTCYLRTCSLTDVGYNSYIEAAASRYIIDYLDISIQQNQKRGLQVFNNSEIRSVKANIIDSSVLMRSCNDSVLTNVVQTGANGFLLTGCNRISVKNTTFTGDRLASTSSKCIFENVTATAAVFLFTSGQEDHTIINSTLNGVFYGFGTGIRNYAYALMFGTYNLWVDATGKLRIKSSAPTTDLDGTVVGTQT